MNRRQMLVGSTTIAGAGAIPFRIDATTFGVVGDGIADDAPAIQAALDHAGNHGGGAVLLPPPAVHYRIAKGLKLPSHVTLEGPTAVSYPFNRANNGVCALVADFTEPRQWILEPATQIAGRSVPHDQLIAGNLPDGVTYNCGVRNLLLTSKGIVPFGGIRMHGCPGSTVDGVSIDRVGCGFLVNYSFGGRYKVHVDTLYYGVAAWDDANGNIFDVYCTHRIPWPTTVPLGYRLPFMLALQGSMVDVHKLSTEDHATRPFGILCGSISSTSINNVWDVIVEQFPGGMFLLNAYATDFRRCYLEGAENRMTQGIVASRSRFGIQALHAYLSGTGALFDLGTVMLAKIFGSGIVWPKTFGKMPADDSTSLLILEGIEPGTRGAPIRADIRYLGKPAAWIPLSLQSGWGAEGGDYELPTVRFDPWTQRIEMKGTISGGRPGLCCILPQGYRPTRRRRYVTAGGTIEIAPDGSVRLTKIEPLISLDGISFEPW